MTPDKQLRETIAKKLRALRLGKNYTQEYMAAKLGISQNAYSKLELGYTGVTVANLIKIASVLEFNVQDFLNDIGR